MCVQTNSNELESAPRNDGILVVGRFRIHRAITSVNLECSVRRQALTASFLVVPIIAISSYIYVEDTVAHKIAVQASAEDAWVISKPSIYMWSTRAGPLSPWMI